MNGQPKTPFYLVLFVVGGLLAFAAYRSDLFGPKGRVQEGPGPGARRRAGDIDPGHDRPVSRRCRLVRGHYGQGICVQAG